MGFFSGITFVVNSTNGAVQTVFSCRILVKLVYFGGFSVTLLRRFWLLGIAVCTKYASLVALSCTKIPGLVLWKIYHLHGHKRLVLPEYCTLLPKNVGDTSLIFMYN